MYQDRALLSSLASYYQTSRDMFDRWLFQDLLVDTLNDGEYGGAKG